MYVNARERLVDWLHLQLIGAPRSRLGSRPTRRERTGSAVGEGSWGMSPLERYPTGVLHPVDCPGSGVDPASTDGEASGSLLLDDDQEMTESADGDADGQPLARPVRRRRYVPPSSVGFSFFVRGERPRLSITCSASVYQEQSAEGRDKAGRFIPGKYARTELPEKTVEWSNPTSLGESPKKIWDDEEIDEDVSAEVHVRARQSENGFIVTVTLCNRAKLDPDVPSHRRTKDRVEKSLFEASLSCEVERGELAEYPRVDPSLLSEEEQELELQYREKRIYAVGHGAAADWDVRSGKARVWSEFMPVVEVPIMTADTWTRGNDAVLRLEHLAEAPMADALESFVDGYAEWVAGQQREASEFPGAAQQAAATRICDRMTITLERMRECVDMLRHDPLAAEAFQLANRAMLDQMVQADRVGSNEAKPGQHRWRPFQLAFLLTVLVSVIREEDDFRDVLDLIWFPTGGGKTEAYLGLIALLIVWRRLKYSERGKGTTAFMRYTLRLLAGQQFERAARIVCALELIRRRRPERLGKDTISVGLWVGSAISPNRYDQAREVVEEIKDGKPGASYKLVMDRCPWCNKPFEATDYHATEDMFCFRCTNHECDFGKDRCSLPLNVVDEALYDHPPSLLIGTIDKFARVAWEERTGRFFGVGTNSRPPELVIQDELHLVTGPLGSVAGLYEAGLDTLLTRLGVRPKYVASTATTRMAREQVRRLYARDLAVFPPPGLSHDDTWFAHTDRDRPGRLYVGYLAPWLDQQHCMAPLAAALLAAPMALFHADTDGDALLDAWWTQVIYHGSLKGVGNSHNSFVTEIRDRGRRFSKIEDDEEVLDDSDGATKRMLERFQDPRIAQLTSRRTARENTETFQQLERSQDDETCFDAVLATNMVSVGLDVPRLALMIVNGQPLTTEEYIQTTSRVGRAEVPGLVVANYYRHQARSLSHYESFRPYHESFYRFVEPSSVTPHTWQVRCRALHAALVIALRHVCQDLRRNTSAGNLDRDAPEVQQVIAELEGRCKRAAAESGLGGDTAAHLHRLAAEWHDEARRCKRQNRQLNYQARSDEKNADRLLYTHGESRPGIWATLHSMRNVESTGSLKVHDWPPRASRYRGP